MSLLRGRGYARCSHRWAALFVLLLAAACSGPQDPPDGTQQPEDPLRNTRKLVVEGHRSLYDNGAFTLPFTEVKLIPPGPTAQEFAFETAMLSAGASYRLHLEQAKRSIVVMADGTRYSYELASTIHRNTAEIVAAIEGHMHPGARLIAYKSQLAGAEIRGSAWQAAESSEALLAGAGQSAGGAIVEEGVDAENTGREWIQGSRPLAMAIVAAGTERGQQLRGSIGAEAEAMREAMVLDADAMILTGAARLGSSPSTVAKRTGQSVERGSRTGERVEAAGRELAEGSLELGGGMVSDGAGRVASSPGSVAEHTRQGVAEARDFGERHADTGAEIDRSLGESGGRKLDQGLTGAGDTFSAAMDDAGAAIDEGHAGAAMRGTQAKESFVVGYAVLPQTLAETGEQVNLDGRLEELGQDVAASGDWRREKSDRYASIVSDTVGGYGEGVRLKLERAGAEFDETSTSTGVTFASLRALRWVVEGLIWDGVLEPLGRVVYGSLGYLAVNGVVYPVMVAYDGSKATAMLAVQVTKAGGTAGYAIVAPTGQSALAGTLAVGNALGGYAKAGGLAAWGTLKAGGQAAAGGIQGVALKTGGAAGGAATTYIGVPLVQAGLVVKGAAKGVLAGTAALGTGTGKLVAGSVIAGGGYAAGKTTEYAGAPIAQGAATAAGTAGGVAEGIYDEATGAMLFATGGVVTGSAYVAEASLKYGAAPVAQGATRVGADFAAAGAEMGQAAAGSAVYLWGQAVQGTGIVAGAVIEHGLAPVTKVGIVAAGTIAGDGTAIAGAATSSVTYVATGAATGVTWLFGNTVAGTTLVGGTTASVAYGGATGLYEVAMTAGAPVSHVGGAGVVLSYKTLTHVGAHSVLGVADASYAVLSLEGPRWVLYAVQGKLVDGEALTPGTVLDLKAMQAEGEVFYNIPVSDAEMQAVVNSTVEELPREANPDAPADSAQ